VAIAIVGVSCLLCVVGLLVGAFTTIPDAEAVIQSCESSDASVASETSQTLLIFALGYLSTLAARRRSDLANQFNRALCLTNAMVSSGFAYVVSAVANVRASRMALRRPCWFNKSVMAIVVAATLCTGCIISLVVSAFTAEPYADPANSGLASESSTGMKVFTVGWMFILSFKLRRELIGLVGSGCLLQPW